MTAALTPLAAPGGSSPLAWAAAVSVALHVAVLAGFPDSPAFSPTPARAPLNARIAPGAPAATPGTAPPAGVERSPRADPAPGASAGAGAVALSALGLEAVVSEHVGRGTVPRPGGALDAAKPAAVARADASVHAPPSSRRPAVRAAPEPVGVPTQPPAGSASAADEPSRPGAPSIATAPLPERPDAAVTETALPGFAVHAERLPSAARGGGAGSARGEPSLAPRLGEDLPDLGTLAQYRLALMGAAKRHRLYPAQAIDRGWSGRVDVRLVLGSDGTLARAEVRASSGHATLDRQAVEMLRKATELTPLPPALRHRDFTVDVPVVFELNGAS